MLFTSVGIFCDIFLTLRKINKKNWLTFCFPSWGTAQSAQHGTDFFINLKR